ncbi:MAG: hypothetical protein EAY65_05150 [Alphaproteobacteria bacterium]|nr:MAG: hypothetical protein EAY65_05150 [Alphaproteobacteria bacterium]
MVKHPKHRKHKPRAQLVRCVHILDGRVVLDLSEKLPVPQSLWIGEHPDVWERMHRHDAFSAWFGCAVDASTLITQGEHAYREAAFRHISLAQKARDLVLGYEDVMRALTLKQLDCVIIATDAGASDASKIRAHTAHASIACHSFGTRATLGAAVGRHAQVFLGVRSGAFAEKIDYYIQRNTRFMLHLSL